MVKHNPIINLLLLLLPILANCQSSGQSAYGSYSVNPNLKDSVEKKLKVYDSYIGLTIYINMFTRDSTILDTYNSGNGLDGTFITGGYLSGDTITAVGFWGTIIYRFKITKESCKVSCIVSTDEKTYKLKPEDELSDKITVQSEQYSLTLLHHPVFKNGETIEGIIDFTTDEFLQVVDGVGEAPHTHDGLFQNRSV